MLRALALIAVAASVRFEDASARAGITQVSVYGGIRAKSYILETTGTGAAFFDYDDDGDQDLFLVNGTRLGMTEHESPSSTLYRNDGNGTFTDVTPLAGLVSHGWGQGAATSDVDNDGDVDLLVTYYGRNRFYRNNGDGTFVELAQAVGLDDPAWGTSAAFADYDGDGFADVFVANYVDFDLAATPGPGETPNCFFMGIPVMCGPRGLPPARSVLFRNDGTGRFVRVEDGAIGEERYFGLGAAWGDVDDDGDVDLYVANDQTPNNLFINDGKGGFVDAALEAGVAFNEDGRAQAGMGVDLGDYDGDGFLDIHVTNFSHDYNTLYRNTGQGYFLDESFQASIGEATYSYLGWGTGFRDFDRDGLLDIFVANGHVYPEVDAYPTDSHYAQPNLLFLNRGGSVFSAASVEEAKPPSVSRGAAFADYDDDGDVDVLVTNMNAAPSLLENQVSEGAWIGFRLVGRRSTRDALGARVHLVAGGREQIREVRSGASYLSQSDLRLFFGLGKTTEVDRVEIRWPSGTIQNVDRPRIGRYQTVVEP